LQKGVDYFLMSNVGYIPFALVGDHDFAPICLSDPICHQESMLTLLDRFFQLYDYPVFLHISRETAALLAERNFLVNEIGTETLIDVQHFSLSGKERAFLRSQINRAEKDGVTVKEQRCSQAGAEVLKAISASWLTKKVVHTHELSFIVRPAVYSDEPDVRKFVAYRRDSAIGFGAFDPIYRDGRVIGYLANTLRTTGDFSYSVSDYIVMEALRTFKEEGKDILSLGYSPLYKVNDSGEFNYSKLLKGIFKCAYEFGECLYEFKALAFHKSRYHPGHNGCREMTVYCACPPPVRLGLIGKVFELVGVDAKVQVAEQLIIH
jgi:lysylphosphatidylglycerol synthetase-like protein (DUF2156 family)